MYKCQNKVIFFNGKSDITLEINGENIITVFIQKSIAILELKEKKFVYFYHTTEESNKQGQVTSGQDTYLVVEPEVENDWL